MRDPIQEFKDFNRPFTERNPNLVRFKIARMAESPFAFFRGTFHLFARDVLDGTFAPTSLFAGDGVDVDLVGDLHGENYGTLKGADRLIHYDVNDFDETTQGRFDFDLRRLATSWFLSAQEQGKNLANAMRVPTTGLAAYAESIRHLLKKGADGRGDIREGSPSGCVSVDALLRTAADAKRPTFIQKLTELQSGKRLLRRSDRYFNLPEDERARVEWLLADYRRRQTPPLEPDEFFQVEDICGRVAGIGSMGRHRYAVLLAGKGSADGRNVLLEFKESRPSAYDLYRQRDTRLEARLTRAERVITVQRQSQVSSSPRLGFAVDGELSFQVREIAPADARLDAKALKATEQLEAVAHVQGAILARIHAGAASRTVGPANALADTADANTFSQRVLAFALAYADQVHRDWTKFVGARGELEGGLKS